MSNKELENMLEFDPIAAVEEITEKFCDTDKESNAIKVYMYTQYAQRKKELLESLGDTTINTTYNDYVKIITELGFKLGYEKDYVIPDASDTSNEYSKFCVYYHKEMGLVLSFDTYWNNTSINGGSLYFNMKDINIFLPSMSGGFTNDILVGHFDCREALIHKITSATEEGTFLPIWEEKPFLWFIHYSETKNGEYDHNELNEEKMKDFCPELKAIIGIK